MALCRQARESDAAIRIRFKERHERLPPLVLWHKKGEGVNIRKQRRKARRRFRRWVMNPLRVAKPSQRQCELDWEFCMTAVRKDGPRAWKTGRKGNE